MTTQPSYYFFLETYAHLGLFEGVTHVWGALENIKKYLEIYCQKHPQEVSLEVFQGVYFENASSIRLGKGVRIEPGAYVKGPCYIGDYTVIRHGAYIRGDIITGNNCIIGHGTEIKHSILLDDVHAAHFNYVGDSILGNHVNLGAGVKCANFRLDQKNVHVRIGREKIDTGLQKLGAVVGDNGQIGCNCVTNPGTFLGPGVLCSPCQNISGFIAQDVHLIRPLHSLTT